MRHYLCIAAGLLQKGFNHDTASEVTSGLNSLGSLGAERREKPFEFEGDVPLEPHHAYEKHLTPNTARLYASSPSVRCTDFQENETPHDSLRAYRAEGCTAVFTP